MSDLERFLSKVSITDNGCWEWRAATNDSGYGIFTVKRKAVRAHRWAFEHYKGAIPQGLDLDHLCRNRFCCNPDHLEAVTRKTNLYRGVHPNMTAHLSNTCRRGHPFTEDSTTHKKDGTRFCAICENERYEARRAQPDYKEKRREIERRSRRKKREAT